MATFEQRVQVLSQLNTKGLVNEITQAENDYEAAMRAENDYKGANAGFLSSGTNDSREVKGKLAEVSATAPKMTAAEREHWLEKQRAENAELAGFIKRQQDVAFALEDHRIKVEMARRKLERLMAVLELRRAQIDFLGAVKEIEQTPPIAKVAKG